MEKQEITLCSHSNCDKPIKHYCNGHNDVFCISCTNTLHFDCNYEAIKSSEELEQVLLPINSLVIGLRQQAEAHDLGNKIDGLEGVMKNVSDEVDGFGKKVKTAIDSSDFMKFGSLFQEGKELKSKILSGAFGMGSDGSNPIYRLLFDLQLLSCSSRARLGGSIDVMKGSKALTKGFYRSITNLHQKTKEENAKEYKTIIEELLKEAKKSDKGEKEAQKFILELQNKVIELEQQLQIEKDKSDGLELDLYTLKTENEKLIKENKELEEKGAALTGESGQILAQNAISDSSSISKKKCEALYEKHVGVKKTFDEVCQLKLKMCNIESQNFINALCEEKVILPKINEIHTAKIDSNCTEIINRYLLNCIPKSIPKIYFNWGWSGKVVHFSSMIEGLSIALPKITKEVMFDTFVIQASDLELIMQKCYQAEKIIFIASKLVTAKEMNFDTNKGSKLKCLSFYRSDYEVSNLSSNFKDHPERLEWIIEALSRSPHKKSLESINIDECPIGVGTVNEMLKKYGMDKIVVRKDGESLPQGL
ncbi:unnamed protein product [Moneuplotes crassus]|uniref:Uncharacterized protein n=1 Tax=Euplotes crassus TaxID=5936 RepID=A0AAD1UEW9_EUPCR|nr:unnamed protein product [Moneuplotes crassus]